MSRRTALSALLTLPLASVLTFAIAAPSQAQPTRGHGSTASTRQARPLVSLKPSALSLAPGDYVVDEGQCTTAIQDGTYEHPFCTISAATALVNPGGTVLVAPGTYTELLDLTRSGTSGNPWQLIGESSVRGRVKLVNPDTTSSTPTLTISGAHDVKVEGIDVTAGAGDGLDVDASSDVTIDGGLVSALHGVGVHVSGASSDVTVSREISVGFLSAIKVDGASTGTVISTNQAVVRSSTALAGIQVSDAPGTAVTSNTVVGLCVPGIVLTGASTGSTVADDIVDLPRFGPQGGQACATPANATAITISSGSTSGTTAGFNLIDPASTGALYSWGGTAYTSLSDFTAATGQGTGDIAANPLLHLDSSGLWYAPASPSPAIDSADIDAPGELSSDMFGNGRADDPSIDNSGGGFADRGAIEMTGPIVSGPTTAEHAPGPGNIGSPLLLQVDSEETPSWTTNGSTGIFSYTFSDSATPTVTSSAHIGYPFARAGYDCAHLSYSPFGFRTNGSLTNTSGCAVLGANYTAITPIRILDTRSAIGVGTTTPVAAGATLELPFAGVGGIAAADISGVELNVTVTGQTAGGHLDAYPAGPSAPGTSTVNFIHGQTRANSVVLTPGPDGFAFHNSSAGTLNLVVDMEGYYGQSGVGYNPLSPVRVLDTRNATGVSTRTPVRAGGTVTLTLTPRVPAGATAVVLNLTATQPEESGHLTAFPFGQVLPLASNVNYNPGQTVANRVVVPLVGGKISIHNASSGHTHVIADLEGYFKDVGSDTFVPFGPGRIVDTRTGLGIGVVQPVGAHSQIQVLGTLSPGCTFCVLPTAWLYNVTATKETAGGYLIAYPFGQSRPVGSTLNFPAGQSVANLVSAADPNGDSVRIDNVSNATLAIVVDEEGYYIPVN